MKVTITARHIDDKKLSYHLKDYALKKVPRIEKLMNEYRDPTEIKIVLTAEKLRNRAEIILSDGTLKTTASVETEDMHSSIDRVIDTIIKQLRRKSDKQSSLKRRSTASFIRNKENNSKLKKVFAEKLPLKPMSLDEALLQLDVNENKFFAFRNSDNGDMNVLYYKTNSSVGLITP